MRQAREWLTEGKPEKKVILYVGRWSPEKGILQLIDAKPKDAILSIVGDGPQGDVLEAKHDPSNGVIIKRGIVNQDRLRVLYKASDVFVSASKFETLGMTVCESVLCGTPVVCQRAPGFINQIKEGVNGYLCDFDNSEETRELLERVLAMDWDREALKVSNKESWDTDLKDVTTLVAERRPKTSPGVRLARRAACIGALPFVLAFWFFMMTLSLVIGRKVIYNDKGLKVEDTGKIRLSMRHFVVAFLAIGAGALYAA